MSAPFLQYECRPAVGGYRLLSVDCRKFKPSHFDKNTGEFLGPLPANATDEERLLVEHPGGVVSAYVWAKEPVARFLTPNSERTERFDLFKTDPDAYLAFARAPMTPEAALGLANRFGLLHPFRLALPPRLGIVLEDVDFWLVAMKSMRLRVTAWEHASRTNDLSKWRRWEAHPIGGVEVRLKNSVTASPQLLLKPANLGDALMVQLALAIAGGQELGACSECRTLFAVHAGRGRSDKEYCSDACRMRAYRKRKNEAPRKRH